MATPKPQAVETPSGFICTAPAGRTLNPRCGNLISEERVLRSKRDGRWPLYCSDACQKREYAIRSIISQAKKLGMK